MAKRRISWYFRCRRRAASGPFGLTFICNTLWLQKGPDASPFHECENSSPRPEAAKTGRTPGIRGQNARGSETSEIAERTRERRSARDSAFLAMRGTRDG